MQQRRLRRYKQAALRGGLFCAWYKYGNPMSYLIECPKCNAMMGVEVRGQIVEDGDEDFPLDTTVSLCQCPNCGSAIIGMEINEPEDSPSRVWPSPDKTFSYKIPFLIRRSLEEAQKCLKAQAYDACAMMCGRALEAIGRHFYPDKNNLMLGYALDKLAEDKIIDGRLHEWGKVLHDDRNLAAHPSGTDFKKQDAKDELKFASNICEYIFVLSADFKEFEKRRAERALAKKK